jgi:hypothetical protein
MLLLAFHFNEHLSLLLVLKHLARVEIFDADFDRPVRLLSVIRARRLSRVRQRASSLLKAESIMRG